MSQYENEPNDEDKYSLERIKKDLKQRIEEEDLYYHEYPNEIIQEVIDEMVMDYKGRMAKITYQNFDKLTKQNPRFWAFDTKKTPYNGIAANLYQELERYAMDEFDSVVNE